jgi:ribosome-binding factor A
VPRRARLAEQIQQELALLLQREVKDPRIGLLTLTGVELSADYAHAGVYFTVLPDDPAQSERSAEGLRSAAGFLRNELGRRIRMHTVPELRFHYDPSTRRGMAMSQLIDQALARESAAEHGAVGHPSAVRPVKTTRAKQQEG